MCLYVYISAYKKRRERIRLSAAVRRERLWRIVIWSLRVLWMGMTNKRENFFLFYFFIQNVGRGLLFDAFVSVGMRFFGCNVEWRKFRKGK